MNKRAAFSRYALFVATLLMAACSSGKAVPDGSPAAGSQAARATGAKIVKVFKTNANWPWAFTIGPDGNMWFVESNARSYAGRVTPAGTETLFPIHVKGFTADDIVSGTDGNLWIDDGDAGLVKMGVDGTFTIYRFTSPSFFCCRVMAPVANGELWVGAQTGNTGVIVKLDRNGHVLEHFIPSADQFESESIVPETNEAVWITTERLSVKGTILELVASSGIVRTLNIPQLGFSMVRGGDGNLWLPHFAERIARVTTQGVVTDFPTGPQSHPGELTVGQDGSIWFIMHNARQWFAAHMTLQGKIVDRYQLPFGIEPIALRVGKDGSVWVSYIVKKTSIDGNAETVGRIVEFAPAQ